MIFEENVSQTIKTLLLFQLREDPFFHVFFQNRQDSLVSKKNKKQSLIIIPDKREKIVKKMLCSKKT